MLKLKAMENSNLAHNQSTTKKKCTITQSIDKFKMEVDEHTIPFTGVTALIYFRNFYQALGYRVKVVLSQDILCDDNLLYTEIMNGLTDEERQLISDMVPDDIILLIKDSVSGGRIDVLERILAAEERYPTAIRKVLLAFVTYVIDRRSELMQCSSYKHTGEGNLPLN